MDDDELPEQTRKAKLAVHQARKQVEDEWSVYRALARTRIEVGGRIQQALADGEKDIEAHQEYAALRTQLDAQRQVVHRAMFDLEKSKTERRAAHDAASCSQAEV